MALRLRKTTVLVKSILECNPNTRNSDSLLYIEVCKKLNPEVEHWLFFDVLRNQSELGLPSIETVGRCRRKVVETYPELAGCSDVEAQRILNEEEFIDYGRQVVI